MSSPITDAPSIQFDPQPREPVRSGLFTAITNGDAWTDVGEAANRFSINGVQIRTINYGGEASTGVWGGGWCGNPGPGTGEKGYGAVRPEFPNPFDPIIVWAWDACDFSDRSRDEVERNAALWLSLQAETDVEHAFSVRLLSEAGAPLTSTSFLDAVGKLEAEIAKTSLPGFIHANPYYLPYAAAAQLLIRDDGEWVTPAGTVWVFGGGYVDGLDDVMVATSQPYGWRDAPALTTGAVEPSGGVTWANLYVAMAEQTFAVGYEKLIAAVTVTIP